MEVLFMLVILTLFSCGVGALGKNRKIGFGWAFFFSFILSPIIGLIITLCSKKNSTEFVDINKEKEA